MTKRRNHFDTQSVRALRVGEAMRHALAELFQRGALHDATLDRFILSVSEVEVTPDLRHATAYILPLDATPDEEQQALTALRQHQRFLQGEVARRVNTRYAAELRFELDSSFDEGSRIDAILRSPEVARDLKRPQDEGAASDKENQHGRE